MCTLKKCVPLFFSLCLVPVSISYAAGDEHRAAAGDKKPMITDRVVVSPDEQVAQSVVVRDVTMDNGTVSGVVVNNLGQVVRDINLAIRYGWMWKNEFRPGKNEPSRVDYYTVPGEIAPGASVPFTYHPESPLPHRSDGRFRISVQVVEFDRFKSEGSAQR
jgi:hypothetical protein